MPSTDSPSRPAAVQTHRRPILKALAGTTVLGSTGYTAIGTSDATSNTIDEWPSLLHNPQNDGYNPQADVSPEGASVQWTFGPKNIAEDDDGNGFRAPIYHQGTLFVGGYERLWALNPQTGDEMWRYDPDAPEPSDMDITALGSAGEAVYVGTDHGTVAAVQATDGTELWNVQVGMGPSNGGHQEGRQVSILGLTAGDGYIFAMEDGTDTENAVLHALDTADGSELWQRDEGAELTTNPREPAQPALFKGTVYDTANGLVALDAETGDEIWGPRDPRSDDLPSYSQGTLFVSGGKHGDTFYAVDAETGDSRWETAFKGDYLVSARWSAVDDERVYAGEADGDGINRLVAFDRETGDLIWENKEYDGGVETGGFSVATNIVFVDNYGTLAALNPETGKTLWKYEGEGVTLPAVVGDTAYIGGNEVIALGPPQTPTPTETQSPTPTDTDSPTASGTQTEIVTESPTETPGDSTPTTTVAGTPNGTLTVTPTDGSPVAERNVTTATSTTAGGPGFGPLATVGGVLGGIAYAVASIAKQSD